jgi:hypothetical protein
MEQWNFIVRWREGKKSPPSNMRFEFSENGFVRYHRQQQLTSHVSQKSSSNSTLQEESDDFVVGTWELAPSGVIWNMELDSKSYSFYADLHLNSFGKYPKMFRGLVIRDRQNVNQKRFLRPVAATFTGMGDGVDTADFSYKKRGFGPYQSSSASGEQ